MVTDATRGARRRQRAPDRRKILKVEKRSALRKARSVPSFDASRNSLTTNQHESSDDFSASAEHRPLACWRWLPAGANSLLRSSAPPPSADQINRGPQLKQRIIRRLNPIQARNRIEDNLLLFVRMIGNCTRQRNGSQLHNLPLGWPMHCRVINNIAVLSNLNRDLELDRALRQPLIQLVEQIIRSLR